MSDKLKVSKVESKGYGNIYKLPMLDRDLDVVAKAFYAYLCSFAGQGETAFPGIDKICHDLNVSKSRLERHRKALIEKGYITVTQVKEKGRFARNEYHINKELIPYPQNEPTEIACTENEPTHFEGINNNSINKNNNNNIKTLSPKFSTFDMQASERLFELMLINNPTAKKPNLEKWANDVRLMRERDDRTEEQIIYLIEWSQNDSFWKSNILSTGKLREKFDSLVVKIKSQKEAKQPIKKVDTKNNGYAAMDMMLNKFEGGFNSETSESTNNRILISENSSTF